MTVLLDLDAPPPAAPDRPVGRRWILGGLLGAAGAAALVRAVPRERSGLAATPGRPWWGSFAGPVPDSDLYLLVAVDATGSAIAHACDGAATAVWFHGRADGDALTAASDGGAVPLGGRPGSAGTGHRLVARVSPDRIAGTVTVDGVELPFALGPTASSGGLFAARTAARDRTYAASWVLLGRGRQRGVLTVGRLAGPAPALRANGVATGDGVRLHPVRLDRFTRKWGRLASAVTVTEA